MRAFLVVAGLGALIVGAASGFGFLAFIGSMLILAFAFVYMLNTQGQRRNACELPPVTAGAEDVITLTVANDRIYRFVGEELFTRPFRKANITYSGVVSVFAAQGPWIIVHLEEWNDKDPHGQKRNVRKQIAFIDTRKARLLEGQPGALRFFSGGASGYIREQLTDISFLNERLFEEVTNRILDHIGAGFSVIRGIPNT